VVRTAGDSAGWQARGNWASIADSSGVDNPGTVQSFDDLSRHVFEDAEAECGRELTEDELKRVWAEGSGNHCMGDGAQAVRKAQAEYQNKRSSKARKGLPRFSAKIQ